jgi:hypothetical protein
MALEREVLIEREETQGSTAAVGTRVSWSGIFGGVIVGIGVLLLMTALGIAIGVTSVDPNNPDAGTIGRSAAIYTGVSLLLAVFIGGWAAARMSMLWDRTAALFQGTLVWALFMLLTLWLAASGISLVAGQTFSLLGSVAQTAGAAAGASAPNLPNIASGDVDEVLRTLDNPNTAAQIATATGMDREEVARNLSELRGRVEAARNDPAQVASEVRQAASGFAERAKSRVQQAASDAQPAAARTAWTTFGALLLGLLAGMAGAAVGRRNAATRVEDLRGSTAARAAR